MLTRRDGTPVTIDNLTDEDVALSPWNILEHLDSEEEIAGYLEAALEECPGDIRFYSICLADAAKARFINRLAKDAGIDRQALCDMFLESPDKSEAPEISRDVVLKVAKTFAVPVPV